MGNKTGWIVAGVLVGAILVFLFFFIFMPPASVPFATAQPGFMDFKIPETPLTAIIPAEDIPDDPGNAADDYAKAVTFYKQHKGDIDATADAEDETSAYNVAIKAPDPWVLPNFKIVKQLADMVAAGTKKAEMKYTFVMTPKKLRPFFQLKYARDLYQISLGPFQCYQVHFDRKEYPQAEKCIQDTFFVGWHMFNERALPDMSMQGIDIMIEAVAHLENVYRAWDKAPKDRIRALREYGSELREIRENWRQKRTLLWDSLPSGLGSISSEFHAGDVFNMAENEQDHAWKTQAILCLGPMKFRCVDSRGDSKKVRDLIAYYLQSDDPLFKAAAECAKAMTVEQYQRLGMDFSDMEE